MRNTPKRTRAENVQFPPESADGPAVRRIVFSERFGIQDADALLRKIKLNSAKPGDLQAAVDGVLRTAQPDRIAAFFRRIQKALEA